MVLLLASLMAMAQPKPRIDFDRLIAALPDLPWDFEIRYVVNEGPQTDMLRIYYDGRADVIRWRPEYAGSLASVCHGDLDDKSMRKLLELLREKKFNDVPSDSESVVAVALTGDATVSVRLGRTIVRKIDRRQRENPRLREIESVLDQITTGIVADPKSTCDMESVPARP
jgi:hypothetical protein